MTLHSNTRVRLSIVLALCIALAVVATACGMDTPPTTGTETAPPRSTGGLLGTMFYHGPTSLETRILSSDVIARVELVSASQVVERLSDYPTEGDTSYVKALEFKFKALEYLKGSGGNKLVAVAYDREGRYETEEGAAASAEDFLSVRDTRWDDREAIVFLWDDHLYVPSTKKADRYSLGALRYFAFGGDNYTIASRHNRMWLPAASANALAGVIAAIASGGGEQRFLLEAPNDEASVLARSAQGGTDETQTIALSELKERIAEVEKEVKAGDGSEEYWECVQWKYMSEGRVRYIIERDGEYYHNVHDVALASGDPAGSHIYTWHFYGGGSPTDPAKYKAEDWIGGRDGKLFSADLGTAHTARPLPEGEYRLYFSVIGSPYNICDGLSEEEKKRHEFIVTVTAPSGTLHEAFFDPEDIGASVGADSYYGVLEPAQFTAEGDDTTTIQRIAWNSNRAWIELSTSTTSLTDHHIDFIEIDGSVGLRLDFDDATATTTEDGAHTLVWGVCDQPWTAGDKLMVRMSLSEESLTGATNDTSCNGIPIDTDIRTTE